MDKLSATTFWFEVGRVILYGVIFSFVIMVAEGGKRPVYDLTWLYRLVWAIVVPVIPACFGTGFLGQGCPARSKPAPPPPPVLPQANSEGYLA